MAKLWKPAAVLLVTFALAVSLKNDFVYFLLGLELMVYLAAFCQALWLSQKVKVRVLLPETRVLRGESFQIRAELTNTSRFPIPQLMVRLRHPTSRYGQLCPGSGTVAAGPGHDDGSRRKQYGIADF